MVLVTHSDEEQLSEDFMELCSEVDSVLADVDGICWLRASSEAGSFEGHEGIRVEVEANGCEAQFCKIVSVAGDRGGLSGSFASTVAERLGLGCESGMRAGRWTAVC